MFFYPITRLIIESTIKTDSNQYLLKTALKKNNISNKV
mgnify:CR=1 FL=1